MTSVIIPITLGFILGIVSLGSFVLMINAYNWSDNPLTHGDVVRAEGCGRDILAEITADGVRVVNLHLTRAEYRSFIACNPQFDNLYWRAKN